jgi:methylmalonyl-CoA mutase cobalamin-binding subunit
MSKSKSTRPVILCADGHRDAHTLMNRAFASAGIKAVILPATDGTEVLGYLQKAGKRDPKFIPGLTYY